MAEKDVLKYSERCALLNCGRTAVLLLKHLFYKAPEISFDAFVAIYVVKITVINAIAFVLFT